MERKDAKSRAKAEERDLLGLKSPNRPFICTYLLRVSTEKLVKELR